MLTDIDAKLKEAEQGALQLKRIDAMLQSLRDEKLELEKKKIRLEGELEKEKLDVDKLENKEYWPFLHSATYGERLRRKG